MRDVSSSGCSLLPIVVEDAGERLPAVAWQWFEPQLAARGLLRSTEHAGLAERGVGRGHRVRALALGCGEFLQLAERIGHADAAVAHLLARVALQALPQLAIVEHLVELAAN